MEKKNRIIDGFLLSLKEDFRLKSGRIWVLILCCLVPIVSICFSFFYSFFYYISGFTCLLSIIILSIMNRTMTSTISFLMFLLPFSMILKIPNISIGFYPLLVAFSVVGFAIEWLIEVKDKKRSLNLISFIPLVVYVTYLFVLYLVKKSSFINFSTLAVGALLLFAIVEFINDVDIKEVFLLFIFGLLLSCFLGIFSKNYPNLKDFYHVTNALGVERFSGLFPNTNAFTMNVLMAIGMLSVLYLKGKIRIIFYPLMLLLLVVSFETLSKMTYVVLLVLLVSLFIIKLTRGRKSKGSMYSILALICTIVLSVILQFNNCLLISKRLVEPFLNQKEIEQVETETINTNDSLNESIDNNNDSEPNNSLNEFTTGRLDLWKNCIKELTSNTKSLLFGVDAKEGSDVMSSIEGSPHNTFLQVMYITGVIGFTLTLAQIIMYFLIIFRRGFDVGGFVLLVTILGCFISLDAFSYIGFIMVSMIMIAFNKGDEKLEERGIK